jgi:hypothetical protein
MEAGLDLELYHGKSNEAKATSRRQHGLRGMRLKRFEMLGKRC